MFLIKVLGVSTILLVGLITKQILLDYRINIVGPYDTVMKSNHSEDLIGEIELPLSGKDPIILANKFLNELNLLLDSPIDTWQNDTEVSAPLLVQSKKVSGWYQRYKLPVVRAKWIVENCQSNDLFNFLVSPEGFVVIDPVRMLKLHCISSNALFY